MGVGHWVDAGWSAMDGQRRAEPGGRWGVNASDGVYVVVGLERK